MTVVNISSHNAEKKRDECLSMIVSIPFKKTIQLDNLARFNCFQIFMDKGKGSVCILVIDGKEWTLEFTVKMVRMSPLTSKL